VGGLGWVAKVKEVDGQVGKWVAKAREMGGQGKGEGRPRQGRWEAKAREMGGQGEGDGRLNEAGKFAADFVEFD
jgi:hypothetical protein